MTTHLIQHPSPCAMCLIHFRAETAPCTFLVSVCHSARLR